MNFKVIFLLALAAILSSCSSSGPLYSEALTINIENKGQIVIFRQDKFKAGGACFQTVLDKERKGYLANAGFVRFDVVPGNHKIIVGADGEEQLINVEAGKKYFFEFSAHFNITSLHIVSPTFVKAASETESKLVEVSESYALKFLPKLKDSSVKYKCMTKL